MKQLNASNLLEDLKLLQAELHKEKSERALAVCSVLGDKYILQFCQDVNFDKRATWRVDITLFSNKPATEYLDIIAAKLHRAANLFR